MKICAVAAALSKKKKKKPKDKKPYRKVLNSVGKWT